MFSGSDRYTKFWSTLFELHLARHLTHPSVQIEVQADESRERGCDFKVVAQDGHEDIAAIEAYAPHKGIDDWHERIIAAPWRELVGSTLAERSSVRRLESPGIDPDSISRALSGMMTRPSFRAKLEQLNTGDVPTFLAVRPYRLTDKIGDLLALRPAVELADSISNDAWDFLPERCRGLLLCFAHNSLDPDRASSGVIYLQAPDHGPLPAELDKYLAQVSQQ